MEKNSDRLVVESADDLMEAFDGGGKGEGGGPLRFCREKAWMPGMLPTEAARRLGVRNWPAAWRGKPGVDTLEVGESPV